MENVPLGDAKTTCVPYQPIQAESSTWRLIPQTLALPFGLPQHFKRDSLLYRRLLRLNISALLFNRSSNNNKSLYVDVSAGGWYGALGAGRIGEDVCDRFGGLILNQIVFCQYQIVIYLVSGENLGKEELNSLDGAHVAASLSSFPRLSRPFRFYSILHDRCILLLNALRPQRDYYGQIRTSWWRISFLTFVYLLERVEWNAVRWDGVGKTRLGHVSLFLRRRLPKTKTNKRWLRFECIT